MAIDVSGVQPTTTTPASNASSALGGTPSKDEFLKLLVAQLQHQDPLTPQDGTAFVAQLAQFASIEQGAETNQHLTDLSAGQSSELRAGFANLVGKRVTAHSDRIDIPQKAVADGGAQMIDHLDGDVDAMTVTVSDANGKAVKTINMGAHGAGDVEINWDGTNDAGAKVPDGEYHITVKATQGSKAVGNTTNLVGLLDRLEFNSGAVSFKMGAADIAPGDIVEIQR